MACPSHKALHPRHVVRPSRSAVCAISTYDPLVDDLQFVSFVAGRHFLSLCLVLLPLLMIIQQPRGRAN